MEYENEQIEARWLADEMRWGVFPRRLLRAGEDLGVSCDNLPVSQGNSEPGNTLLRRGHELVDPKGSLMWYFEHANMQEANCCLLPNGRIAVESLEVNVDTELRLLI